MDKINVVVYLTTNWEHVSVLLVGLNQLYKNGVINLKIEKENDSKAQNQAGLEIEINGVKCYLDATDGYNNLSFMKERIDNYKYWFKRSYSKVTNDKYGFSNVQMLGLNYSVYDHFTERYFKKTKEPSFVATIINRAKTLVLKLLGLKREYSIFESDLDNFKELSANPVICFTARLWPGKGSENLNTMRINLVKSLKDKYGDNFVGGIYDSDLARELCPDLIVSKTYTQKMSYLERMHNSDICIATTGLFDSIGWKFAEYVIAGKVIISEPLNYEVPYGFEEGKNYVTFTTVNECLDKIDYLVKNESLMREIASNNRTYYKNYLKPDKMMWNIIQKVISDSDSMDI